MARLTRQLIAYQATVRELLPGRRYPMDRILTMVRSKSPRFGNSTLQVFLRHSIAYGNVVRVERGVYAVADTQGAHAQPLPLLGPPDPAADLSARLVTIEEGIILITQQQALLGQQMDHHLALLRQIQEVSRGS